MEAKQLVQGMIDRGNLVTLRVALCLKKGLVCMVNEDDCSEVMIPKDVTGQVTFIYYDGSCQVNFYGYGSFMLEQEWLMIL